MMGMNPQHDDAIRFDAVQELCNIIAGELIADQSEPWRLTPATCDIYKPGGAPITQAHSYEFRDFEDLTLYVGIKAV